MTTAAPTKRPRKRRSRNLGWVPNQHGAWAMLIVPYLIGVINAGQHGRFRLYALPLFALWMLGYFCFNATSQRLKSRRAQRYRTPMLTYGGLAAMFGLLTWLLAGPELGWWLVPYVPVLGMALALAAARKERELIGGLLTIAAAAMILLVAGHADPRTALHDAASLQLTAICFAYFGGTVWVVKTMIRERGKLGWVIASVLWHVIATAVVSIAGAMGHLSWWWTIFFAATTIRAVILPARWTMRGRMLRASKIGIIEIVFSVLLLIIAVTTS